MSRRSYSLGRYRVRSDIVLPDLSPARDGAEAADLDLGLAAVPESLAGQIRGAPTWQSDGDRYLLKVPGVARYLLDPSGTVAVDPEGPAELSTETPEIALFFMTAVLPVWGQARGLIALPAAAVEIGGRALIICGGSACGKSTIAAALAGQGARLLADDPCLLDFSDPATPVVLPTARATILRADSLAALGRAAPADSRAGLGTPSWRLARDACSTAVPAAAIVLLEDRRRASRARPERLRQGTAFRDLLAMATQYRPLRRPEDKPALFVKTAELTRRAANYRMSVPQGVSDLPGIAAGLRDLVEGG